MRYECPGCGQLILAIIIDGIRVFATHQAIPEDGSGDACEYSAQPVRDYNKEH